jgi:hypothetical protein
MLENKNTSTISMGWAFRQTTPMAGCSLDYVFEIIEERIAISTTGSRCTLLYSIKKLFYRIIFYYNLDFVFIT